MQRINRHFYNCGGCGAALGALHSADCVVAAETYSASLRIDSNRKNDCSVCGAAPRALHSVVCRDAATYKKKRTPQERHARRADKQRERRAKTRAKRPPKQTLTHQQTRARRAEQKRTRRAEQRVEQLALQSLGEHASVPHASAPHASVPHARAEQPRAARECAAPARCTTDDAPEFAVACVLVGLVDRVCRNGETAKALKHTRKRQKYSRMSPAEKKASNKVGNAARAQRRENESSPEREERLAKRRRTAEINSEAKRCAV